MSSQTNQNKLRAISAQLELRGCEAKCVHALTSMLLNLERRVTKLEQLVDRRSKPGQKGKR